MPCPKCGEQIAEAEVRCRFCGATLSQDKLPSDGSLQASGAAATGETPKQPARSSPMATASLVLGLFSIVLVVFCLISFSVGALLSLTLRLFFLVPVAGLLAVIFGHTAKASIRRSGRRLGKRRATAGLTFGYLCVVGWAAIIFLVIPAMDFSLRASDQASAVGSLRTINTALTVYSETYHRGFPPTLAVLAPPKAENPSSSVIESENAAGLIDETLASGTKSGYRFSYVPGKSNETGKIQTYTVHADPIKPHASADTHYFTDQSGVIRAQERMEANEHSRIIGG